MRGSHHMRRLTKHKTLEPHTSALFASTAMVTAATRSASASGWASVVSLSPSVAPSPSLSSLLSVRRAATTYGSCAYKCTQRGMGRECGGHNKGESNKGIACERRRTCGGVLGRGSEQIADTEQAPRPSPIIHLHAHEVGAQPSELLRTTQWLLTVSNITRKNTLLASVTLHVWLVGMHQHQRLRRPVQ